MDSLLPLDTMPMLSHYTCQWGTGHSLFPWPTSVMFKFEMAVGTVRQAAQCMLTICDPFQYTKGMGTCAQSHT